MKNQWGALENAAEDLLMLLVSNADTLAQTELKSQLNSVNERLTAIQLGHKDYFSEMSSTIMCHDRLIDRLNFRENRVSSDTGSVRSRDNIGKSVVDLAIDNEEQNRLDELEMKDRRIRRDAEFEREKAALQHCGPGNGQGYTPDEVTDQQRAIIEDCTQNVAARIQEPATS